MWAMSPTFEFVAQCATNFMGSMTVKNHIENILTYAKHRITNALGEAINAKIEKVKRMACGFRNRSHYRTAIYFHCGG
jgi:transposase